MRNQRPYCAAIVSLVLTFAATTAAAEGTFFKSRTPAAQPTPPPTTPAPQPQPQPQPEPQPPVPVPQDQPTEQPQPEPDVAHISGVVQRVVTTSTYVIEGQQFELFGVIGEPSPYVEALSGWLNSNGNRLDCKPEGGKFRCFTPGKVDVGGVVIFNGAGKAAPDAPQEYRNAEAQAKAGMKGVWRG